jgi:hypothetical protein
MTGRLAEGARWFAIATGLALAMGACTERKLGQTAALADATIVFEDRVPEITDSAFAVVVEADSVVFMQTRKRIADPKVRRASLTEANADLREILQSMDGIKANARLIKEFFVTLRALATSDADVAVGESLTGLVGQIDGLAGQLSKEGGFIKSQGEKDAIERILKTGASFAVKAAQNAAVQDVLERYGAAVKKALAVQEAYVAALRQWVEADGTSLLRLKEKEAVIDPYAGSGSLPSDWPARRLAALRATADLAAIAEAETAARRVKQAFDALAEDRLDIGYVQAIVEQLGKIVSVAEDLEALSGKEDKKP